MGKARLSLNRELYGLKRRDWLVIILITTSVSLLVLLANYYTNKKHIKRNLERTSELGLEETYLGIESHFSRINQNINFLTAEVKQRYSSEETRITRLQQTFKNILIGQDNIFQIRLIQTNGNEIVKVSKKGQDVIILADSLLENKASRYYVEEALMNTENELYLSRFDFNIEGDTLEKPLRPSLRILKKLVIGEKVKDTLLLALNYEGIKLLDPIYAAIYQNSFIEYSLIDKNGNYILSSDDSRSWDFMNPSPRYNFYDGKGIDMIKGGRSSVLLEDNKGYYSYKRINLATILEELGQSVKATQSTNSLNWYIISGVTYNYINSTAWQQIIEVKYMILLECWILSILSLLIYYFYQARRSSNKQLSYQNKELEKQSKIKDDFYAIISHDLRSPFTGLIGLSSVIKDEAESLEKHEVKQYGEMIHQASSQTFELLEKLLDWTKAQTSKMVAKPSQFDLHECITACVELYRAVSQDKGINLKVEGYKGLLVTTDRSMFETILRNLLSNALKFTPENGTIEVDYQSTHKGFEIKVKDSGVGIPQDKLKNLFNINVNTSTKGTKNEKGTGLGLPLCKRLAELNYGSIIVHSTENKGTTFILSLPNQ